jgi:inner membrane protein YidH
VPTIPAPDVTERTTLAGERTLLAWWRTGLASLAVGIGVGRIGPELRSSGAEWPYVVLGLGFALFGVALILYGSARGRKVEAAALRGERSVSDAAILTAMTVAGALLGFGTALLVLLG